MAIINWLLTSNLINLTKTWAFELRFVVRTGEDGLGIPPVIVEARWLRWWPSPSWRFWCSTVSPFPLSCTPDNFKDVLVSGLWLWSGDDLEVWTPVVSGSPPLGRPCLVLRGSSVLGVDELTGRYHPCGTNSGDVKTILSGFTLGITI